MKISNRLFYSVWLSIAIAGCVSIRNSTVWRVRHDLPGHYTGGREASWFFRKDNFSDIQILSEDFDTITVSLITTGWKGERFFQVIQLKYTGKHLDSIGQLFIRQL
jgi:hypothetical protein